MHCKSLWLSLFRGWMVLTIVCGVVLVACGPETSNTPDGSVETAGEVTPEPALDRSVEVMTDAKPQESNVSKETTGADASEGTSEVTPEASTEKTSIDCVLSCGDVRVKCVDRDTITRCTAEAGCVVWKTEPCGAGKECKEANNEAKCVARSCSGPGECGKDHHCENGTCEPNTNCCKEGAVECKNNATRQCEKGTDGCGKWSTETPCQTGEGCNNKNKCEVCRHRQCAGQQDCCQDTSCIQGYCLVNCNQAKGDINNPDCASSEFCFPIQTGGQAVCLPDLTEPKGAPCSIIKLCQGGLSCVRIGTDFRCYTDCKPGSTTNRCTAQEACVTAFNTPQGGICAPAKKLHEQCSNTTPCASGHICTGEPGNPTHCLQECNPQNNPTGCPPTDICAGYQASDPTKGICLQRCTNAGTKDNCKYGQCRSKQNQIVCL